jgi:hypothetical protein
MDKIRVKANDDANQILPGPLLSVLSKISAPILKSKPIAAKLLQKKISLLFVSINRKSKIPKKRK